MPNLPPHFPSLCVLTDHSPRSSPFSYTIFFVFGRIASPRARAFSQSSLTKATENWASGRANAVFDSCSGKELQNWASKAFAMAKYPYFPFRFLFAHIWFLVLFAVSDCLLSVFSFKNYLIVQVCYI